MIVNEDDRRIKRVSFIYADDLDGIGKGVVPVYKNKIHVNMFFEKGYYKDRIDNLVFEMFDQKELTSFSVELMETDINSGIFRNDEFEIKINYPVAVNIGVPTIASIDDDDVFAEIEYIN